MTIFKGLFKFSCSRATSLPRPAIHALSIVVFLVMLATASAANATNYWVATTGSDSHSGTQSSPWLTFAHAAATAVAGDTVIFMNGTYGNNGQVNPNNVVNLTNSGTAEKPITFMAQHRGGAILDGGHNDGSTCTGANAYINVANVSYVVIQGFVVRNTCNGGIQDNSTGSFITIRWNEIYNVGTGIVTTSQYGKTGLGCGASTHDIIADGNSIHNIGRAPGQTTSLDQGIYFSCPNETIINNIFYNNVDGWDIQLSDAEDGGGSGAGNVLIANNTFASQNPDQVGQIVLYDVGGSINGLTIQNNIFYNPPMGYALYGYQEDVTNCQVNTNLISNTASVYNGTGCTVGTNLMDTNPDMVNPAGYNYALESGSPAIDAGIILAPVTTDFARACRPQGAGYDIGAYEYVSSCN